MANSVQEAPDALAPRRGLAHGDRGSDLTLSEKGVVLEAGPLALALCDPGAVTALLGQSVANLGVDSPTWTHLLGELDLLGRIAPVRLILPGRGGAPLPVAVAIERRRARNGGNGEYAATFLEAWTETVGFPARLAGREMTNAAQWRELLLHATEHSGFGVVVVVAGESPSFRPILVSPAAERILGMGLEQLRERGSFPPATPEVLQAWRTAWKDRERPDPRPLAVRWITPDGRTRDLEMGIGRGEYWGQAALLILLGDVTERRRTQRQLQESQSLLDAVTSGLPVAIFRLDRAGVVTAARAAHLDAWGLRSKDLAGRSFRDILSPYPEAIRCVERGLGGEPDTSTVESRGQTLNLRVVPLRGPDGSREGVVGVALDTTEASAALRRLRDIRWREYEAELLLEISYLRNELAYDVAHNLRTPLTPLLIEAQVLSRLADQGLPEAVRRAAGVIKRNLARLERMVKTFPASGPSAREPKPVRFQSLDVATLVTRVVEDYQREAAQLGISVQLQRSPRLPAVRGSKDMLVEVLEHLLRDVSGRDPRGFRIIVDASVRGPDLCISLKGRGASPAEAAEDRARPTAQRGPQETAWIQRFCRAVAELHGGRVEFQAHPSEGVRQALLSLPSEGTQPMPGTLQVPPSPS